MKLFEKKCPNCGANLEFDENAKSCKCEYCKRAFEIERENTDSKKLTADDFNLSELKGPLKAFGAYFIGSYVIISIVGVIIFAIAIAGFIFIGSSIYKEANPSNYTTVSQFDNSDYGDFDNQAYHTIFKNDDNLDDYHLNMSVKREKVYLLYDKKEKSNIVYTVYKAKYEKLFDKETTYTIYVPIKYENLKNDSSSIVFQLDNGKVEAPEYYFNLEHSEYSYGYKDISDFEKDVIKPLEKKYTVTKK